VAFSLKPYLQAANQAHAKRAARIELLRTPDPAQPLPGVGGEYARHELERIERDYADEVRYLIPNARTAIGAEWTRFVEEDQRIRRREAERERALLGALPVAYVEGVRAKVTGANRAQLVAEVKAARDPAERALLLQFGAAEWRKLGDPDVGDSEGIAALAEWGQLTAPSPSAERSLFAAEVQSVQEAERRLGELDPLAHQQEVSRAYGVVADLVPLAVE